MATSFYQTDLFIREVTDSGLQPTGGISSAKVRDTLAQIQGAINGSTFRRGCRRTSVSACSKTLRSSAPSAILRMGEMIGVRSTPDSILPMLPPSTRAVFEPLCPTVRPNLARRLWARQAPDAQGRGGTAKGRPGRALKPKAYNPKPKT